MMRSLYLFILTVLPLTVCAYDAEIDGIYYNVDRTAKTAEVTCKDMNNSRYAGPDIVIPSSVSFEGTTYEVTSIGTNAFYGCSNLRSISLPESITSIGEWAFGYCGYLVSINIPRNLTAIGNQAFWNCGVEEIVIPSSLSSWGSNVFYGCNKIKNLILEEGLSTIGAYAFSGCSSITSISIPSSITSFGNYAFYGCTGLEEAVIQEGITSLGSYLFSGCSSLSSVSLPNSLTDLGWATFEHCSSLKSLEIPAGISEFKNSVFFHSGLTNMPNTENIRTIGTYAFLDCQNLTSIHISQKVTNIEQWAFNGCSNVTSITVDANNPLYDSRNNCNAIIYNDKLIRGCMNTVIPEGIRTIEREAFNECAGLTSINLPTSLYNIDSYAFQNCSSLVSVILPEGLKELGGGTFSGCTSLTSMAIPKSVQSLGNAFSGCTNLASITVDPENSWYDSRDNCNAIIETGTNTLIGACNATTIPDDVVAIASGAFSGCDKIQSLDIPESVTAISYGAFSGCTSLSSISFPSHISTIDGYLFSDCYNLAEVHIRATELPQTDPYAFEGDSMDDHNKVEHAVLYVPSGYKDLYANADPWNRFSTIHEEGETFDLFPDCKGGEIRSAAVYLYNKGIIEGEGGLLLPEEKVTRAEVAKTAFYGVYGSADNIPTILPSDNFPSVYSDLQDKDTYYYRAAKALLYLEYGDGVAPFDRQRLSFEPSGEIARINVLKVLMETFNLKPDVNSTQNPFPKDNDVVSLADISPQKMGYIRSAAALRIITTANQRFRPFDNCTRGEAFLMLYRIMKLRDDYDSGPGENDFYQPLNTTLKTISIGTGLQQGNFQHYTKTSFSMDGVMPLTFSHTYNSYNTTLPTVFFGGTTRSNHEVTYQPMGDGWSHNFHSFITVVGNWDGDTSTTGLRAIVHWGGGNIHVYKSGDGGIVPESMGVYDTFQRDGRDVVITSKSQVKYRFSQEDGEGAAVLYLSSITDRNGNTLTIEYEDGHNGSKRIKNVSDGNRALAFSYLEGTDLVESVAAPPNRTISFTYFDNQLTGKKQLKSFTDAEGNTTTYEYGTQQNVAMSMLLTRIKLPKGNYIENEYDQNRRLKNTVNGLNGVPATKTSIDVQTDYSNIYDGCTMTASNVSVKRSDGTGYDGYYQYNDNNVLTEMSNHAYSLEQNYTDNNHPELPTTISIANFADISNVVYDSQGNLKSYRVFRNDNARTYTIQMDYDTMNNLTRYVDGNGNETKYIYDGNGNLTEIQEPEGVTTKIKVNTSGLPEEITNGEDITTKFEFNKFGNLEKTILPALGLSSSIEYDDASRVKVVKDALNRENKFDYNGNDQLLKETDPLGGVTRYQYDANGNLTHIINANDGITQMTYDDATDWLLSMEFKNAKKQYSYNTDGTIQSYTKPDGTRLDYTVDQMGRVTNDGFTTYTYSGPNLSSVSSEGKTMNLSYGNFNRLNGFTYNGKSSEFHYDANDNLTDIDYKVYYNYDGLNRMKRVIFSDHKTVDYHYRKDSQLSKVEYNGEQGLVMMTEFSYDDAGRLTGKETKLGDGTLVAGYTYQLDAVGNVVGQTTTEPFGEPTPAEQAVSYTYNDDNRIAKAGGITFGFDPNGNTKTRGEETYSWNVKDWLTSSGSTAITYNPLGLIESYGDITFTTNPLGMGNVTSDSKSGAEYIYGNGLEARVINGKASFYVTDMRGSVVAIVDEDGNITHKYQYDEFGNVLQKEEADYNPFQYVGKYGVMYLNDHLYYMRARHYDPTIGRFLSEDPIWSTNLYPYADNNPITGIDPKGNATIKYRAIDGYPEALVHVNVKHVQIFFDNPVIIEGENGDRPITDIGYSSDFGGSPMYNDGDPRYEHNYYDTEEYYPDEVMLEAVKSFRPSAMREYNLLLNNCQTYVNIIKRNAKMIMERNKMLQAKVPTWISNQEVKNRHATLSPLN